MNAGLVAKVRAFLEAHDRVLHTLRRGGDPTAFDTATEAQQRALTEMRKALAAEGVVRSEPRQADVSMLAYDHTIELPAFVRDGLGVAPGQYVYFVRRDDGYHLLAEAKMDRALGVEQADKVERD